MALTYRASTSANNNGATTMVVNKPTGTVDGDIMFGFVMNGNSKAWTLPSGWTLISTSTFGTGTHSVAYKVASSEGSSYTWTPSASVRAQGAILTFYDQAASTPVNANAVASGGDGTSVSAANTITPSVADCILIMAEFCKATDGNTVSTSGYAIATNNPAWTEVVDIEDIGTTTSQMAIAYSAARPETTATGNSSCTNTDTGSNAIMTIALAPLISGPTNLKTWDTVAVASVKTRNGVAIASIKTANTIT